MIAGALAWMRRPWSDERAEWMLGALACLVPSDDRRMVAFVFAKAWPSFSHNGLACSDVAERQRPAHADLNSPAKPENYVYKIPAWPLVHGTMITTFFAVLFGVIFATLSAILHRRVRAPGDAAHPRAGRAPAGRVPSVIYA